MIPLVAIAGTLNAIVSLLIAARLYVSYYKTRSAPQGHFLLFYLYLGVFYLYFATSQLLLKDNGMAIGIFHILSYFFLNFSLGYLLTFPLFLSNREALAQRILIGVFLYNVIFTAVRIANFEPSVMQLVGSYGYWRPIFPEWMRALTGFFAVAIGLYASMFFFVHGWQRRSNPFIFYRSLLFGSGIFILVSAAMLLLIVASTGSFSLVAVGTFLVLLGLLIILRGVYYRGHDVSESGV
ncbi:MAG: hypothetical protein AAB372_02870 [Patescibacteria group bacterium]